MKKCIIVLASTVAAIACITIIVVFIQYGYFEYILDIWKIDRTEKSYSVVVTLSIGPNALTIKPYSDVIQIKSNKTITENTFREIRWPNDRFISIRYYGDKIIKGKTTTLSDDEYDTVLNILRNSDFESIQSNIDDAEPWLDGNSTYITTKDGNTFNIIGGHCAENKDKRFKYIMEYILGLLE